MRNALVCAVAALGVSAGLAQAGELTVAHPWTGADGADVSALFELFEQRTGHRVRHVGSDSFEQQIRVDTAAGSAPNVAAFPQPGLAASLAAQGYLTPLAEGTADWIRENYASGEVWADLGTYADETGAQKLFGFMFKADLKSLVWYVPENFEEAGYAVPQSLEELKALTEQIVADGGTPWCFGIGSEAATGWPATDWVEDMMLRTQSPADYDAWVSNEMKFTDPKVIAAIEEFGWFVRKDAFMLGGARGVASTDVRDSPKGLFSLPPACFMHRQGSFVPSFFPQGTVVGEDVDFFYFPAYAGKDFGKPVLGAGTFWAIPNASPEAHELIEFFKSVEAHEFWMGRRNFLTPHKGVDPQAFADPSLRKMNDILLSATTFRFDGSDLMPGAIGTGAFWTGMVEYVGGASAEAVAAQIQARWDALQ
ncbi:MAG: alpha-glucoside ABC transporter substrate-binding protein [Rhodobacterales bacterium]|nr:MAG: alpha-glucoside ABC transporter substrate-binding protein [Rhodobacterales bacterium]PIE09227.1 MAG: alpha-glucoside ABC transporter substrate-binding protein [Rhodobacterales bacterium]